MMQSMRSFSTSLLHATKRITFNRFKTQNFGRIRGSSRVILGHQTQFRTFRTSILLRCDKNVPDKEETNEEEEKGEEEEISADPYADAPPVPINEHGVLELEPTKEDIEFGNWLFSQNCFLEHSIGVDQPLPQERIEIPEIAFAGRSNVGKSSLLNALVGIKKMTPTSSVPGKTQQLNFYRLIDRLILVDMPGYGYAKAPTSLSKEWQSNMFDFIVGRKTLWRVCLLIDARHGFLKNDLKFMTMMDANQTVTYQIILTKADKLNRMEQEMIIPKIYQEIKKRPAAYPEIILTSSLKNVGFDRLRASLGLAIGKEKLRELPEEKLQRQILASLHKSQSMKNQLGDLTKKAEQRAALEKRSKLEEIFASVEPKKGRAHGLIVKRKKKKDKKKKGVAPTKPSSTSGANKNSSGSRNTKRPPHGGTSVQGNRPRNSQVNKPKQGNKPRSSPGDKSKTGNKPKPSSGKPGKNSSGNRSNQRNGKSRVGKIPTLL